MNLPQSKSIGKLTTGNIILYGNSGTGKSTIVSNLGSLVIHLDNRLDHIDCFKFPELPINNIKEVGEVINYLKSNSGKLGNYKFIAVDTINRLYDLCSDEVIRSENVKYPGDLPHGQGWGRINVMMKNFMSGFMSLGLPVIFVAHESNTKGESGIEKISPEITDNLMLWLNGRVSSIFRCERGENQKGVIHRLIIQGNAKTVTKISIPIGNLDTVPQAIVLSGIESDAQLLAFCISGEFKPMVKELPTPSEVIQSIAQSMDESLPELTSPSRSPQINPTVSNSIPSSNWKTSFIPLATLMETKIKTAYPTKNEKGISIGDEIILSLKRSINVLQWVQVRNEKDANSVMEQFADLETAIAAIPLTSDRIKE